MVSYLIPKYVEGLGNCTKLKDVTGEQVLNKTVKSVLKSICNEKMIDLRIAKRRAEKILGQSNLIPIYLNNNEIYIPVRIRRPRVIRDGGYGYINFCTIEKIMDKYIVLKDNSILDYIESKRCLMKRYKMAGVLIESLGERDAVGPSMEKQMKGPATKEDILFLLNEIGKLKRAIERIV
jgi:hypothetical protein